MIGDLGSSFQEVACRLGVALLFSKSSLLIHTGSGLTTWRCLLRLVVVSFGCCLC